MLLTPAVTNSMRLPLKKVGDVDDIVDFVFGIEASDRLSQHIDSTFQLDSDSESYLSDSEGNYSDSDSDETMTDD